MAHIDTSAVIRASLWIPPTGDALEAIQDAMRVVRKRVSGPPIRPHMTLFGGIESTMNDMETKLKKLAGRIAPFRVQLGKLDWRHEYFRCFFATAELSAELAAAHRLAHEVFEMMPPDPFEPHVSLLYGDVDEALKKKLTVELGGRLDLSFTAASVQLVNATADRPITDWKVLSERKLG